MFDLTGRVVVITGASSGLGMQMAHGFAEQGADLVVMARRVEKLEALAEEMKGMGCRCLPIQCDVTKSNEVDAAAKKAEEEFGKVDVLVNCAGSAINGGVLTMKDEEWDFTIDTDMNSVFYVTRAFANIMKKKEYGRIFNIASMYGLVGNNALESVAYHTSKGGVVNFTRAVAGELAKYNITCNAICPGYFETELTADTLNTEEFKAYMRMTVPLGRYGVSGELNGGAVFLASDEASYVTGAILTIDGGYTCL